jgi:hypothetical protein
LKQAIQQFLKKDIIQDSMLQKNGKRIKIKLSYISDKAILFALKFCIPNSDNLEKMLGPSLLAYLMGLIALSLHLEDYSLKNLFLSRDDTKLTPKPIL